MEEKKEEKKDVQEENSNKMRQIIIETDGNNVHMVKAEVSGTIELIGILNAILNRIANSR